MKTLALDLGANTGWAVAEAGNLVASGLWFLGGSRESRFGLLRAHLDAALEQYRPRYLIYEQPTPRGTVTSRVLWGYAAVAELAAFEADIASLDQSPASIKAWATGSGRADKAMMICECLRRTGLETVGSDEADAILLALYACANVIEPEELAS